MTSLLKIENLTATVGDKKVLQDISLEIFKQEINVIMGPNGAGKSSLTSVLLNNPEYKVDQGKLFFDNEDVTNWSTEKRAREGLFASWQYPSEIAGISSLQLLRQSLVASERLSEDFTFTEFYDQFQELVKDLGLLSDMSTRDFNVGLSGGEKKRHELLQMLILKPKLAILDEIDSGLDVDGIKIVADKISDFKKTNVDSSVLIITHQLKLIEYLEPNNIYVMKDGKIEQKGDINLARELDKKGYFQSGDDKAE
ncbi:MAG: Fe-S cluster assembly ATPase SufC [Pseudomonadales bacterium]|jgi:Fe-S cluster assembly ATP-binding protein|nr:Fe-S cluster assembly ATPase SufC [Pseudomonadales bacterium]